MDIPSKESLTVEFKSDTTGNASKHGVDESLLVEAVVAMFNSEGGSCISESKMTELLPD